jgi:hypothetical protein
VVLLRQFRTAQRGHSDDAVVAFLIVFHYCSWVLGLTVRTRDFH